MNPTPPSSDNPYQAPASNPTPPDPEHWRLLRRQLRATVLAEQRRGMGWGGLAVILLFAALHLWPKGDAPLPQQLQDHKTWPALTMIFFTLLASGLVFKHSLAAGKARRRVREVEREHPESAADFFSTP
jgi:hypothetical protein